MAGVWLPPTPHSQTPRIRRANYVPIDDGKTEGRMDEWTNGRTDGRAKRQWSVFRYDRYPPPKKKDLSSFYSLFRRDHDDDANGRSSTRFVGLGGCLYYSTPTCLPFKESSSFNQVSWIIILSFFGGEMDGWMDGWIDSISTTILALTCSPLSDIKYKQLL
jgi:hypothetical protein